MFCWYVTYYDQRTGSRLLVPATNNTNTVTTTYSCITSVASASSIVTTSFSTFATSTSSIYTVAANNSSSNDHGTSVYQQHQHYRSFTDTNTNTNHQQQQPFVGPRPLLPPLHYQYQQHQHKPPPPPLPNMANHHHHHAYRSGGDSSSYYHHHHRAANNMIDVFDSRNGGGSVGGNYYYNDPFQQTAAALVATHHHLPPTHHHHHAHHQRQHYRGIDEPFASGHHQSSGSNHPSGSHYYSGGGGGDHMMDHHQSSGGAGSSSGGGGGGGASAYHLNGDGPSHGDLKKIKLDGSSGLLGNSTSASPTSNSSGGSGVDRGSRVVHIRHVPSDSSIADLLQIAVPFGQVTKHLLCKSKGQAFVEFESHFSALQMANYWAQTTMNGLPTSLQPTIRGRHVQVQMSNHKELKCNFDSNANADYTTTAGDRGSISNGSLGGTMDNQNGTSSTPSPVIRVVLDNMLYSVTLDNLYTIFSRTGKVLKIVTFTKNQVFQSLVQYADVNSSIQAKRTLDGQNMFHACNTLRIEYSKMQHLVVKYNNEKSRDYTCNTLPTGNGPPNCNGRYAAQVQQALSLAAGGAGLAGTVAGVNPLFASSASGLTMGANIGGAIHMSPVLHVNGLAEQMTPEALFILFGVYGDVHRVKILFNKKDTALIQMAEPCQASLAQCHLDRVKLYSKTMRVSTSKHTVVQMPRDGQQDSGLTKDYTNSPLHRFKRPGSKNYHNIYPPSETLHVSNIPATVTEEELKKAFTRESGKDVIKFKFFPNDRRMALVQFDSVESAMIALIKMHNHKMNEHTHLRVSFSKSPV